MGTTIDWGNGGTTNGESKPTNDHNSFWKIMIIIIVIAVSGFLGYFGGHHFFGPPGSESKKEIEFSKNELNSIKEDIAQIKSGIEKQLRLQEKLDADIQELKKELVDHIKNEETEKAIERVLETIKSKKCCEILSNEKR